MSRITKFTPSHFGPVVEAGIGMMPPGMICPSGSIEASEVQGQRELVASEQLPHAMQPSRAAFEELGFAFGEPDGRVRARIFYKAAFYDRRANMHIV